MKGSSKLIITNEEGQVAELELIDFKMVVRPSEDTIITVREMKPIKPINNTPS